ncbi:MAG TPA: hypothetical protein VJ934_12940 [Desulfomicrobiaceae bacterium]|nr:hypothetical protein [Desulfomicrobiaceae bacterium]
MITTESLSWQKIKAVLRTQLDGWSVMWGELQWTAIRFLRTWEIRQLRKRLEQEYTTLGTLTAENSAPEDRDVDMARRQISFLQEEIDHLEQELITARQEFVRRRIETS